MRDLNTLNRYRLRGQAVIDFGGDEGDHRNGAFRVPSPVDQRPMLVIASADKGWDHVSVSRRSRPPTWAEMEHVARLFFGDDETAFQLHVPRTNHINDNKNCLHWWRQWDVEMTLPPAIFV